MTASPPEFGGAATRPRLLDEVLARIRAKHYSRRTEESYTDWVRRFIIFHKKRHPREMGAPEIEAFLSALATTQRLRLHPESGARGRTALASERDAGEDPRTAARGTHPQRSE